MFHIKKTINQIIKHLISSTIILFLISTFLFNPNDSLALSNSQGENLFIQHCSGCHVNGGNIIRRNKTLKISALKRNGLDNPEAIAKVARLGIGSMSGYEEVLEQGEDQIIANWIWEQSQKAWIQG
tara:strand:+ start:1946 stop:2323 length:378 start_codon:yes stop_codon:yes gene_type:complete